MNSLDIIILKSLGLSDKLLYIDIKDNKVGAINAAWSVYPSAVPEFTLSSIYVFWLPFWCL